MLEYKSSDDVSNTDLQKRLSHKYINLRLFFYRVFNVDKFIFYNQWILYNRYYLT